MDQRSAKLPPEKRGAGRASWIHASGAIILVLILGCFLVEGRLAIGAAQAQSFGGSTFLGGVKALGACVRTIEGTGKIFRGSEEECDCLSALDEFEAKLGDLEAALEEWKQGIAKHECSRPYLGDDFRRAKYSYTGKESLPRPDDADKDGIPDAIEAARRAIKKSADDADAACNKVKKPSTYTASKIKDLKKRAGDAAKDTTKKSLICQRKEAELQCISEAIDHYGRKLADAVNAEASNESYEKDKIAVWDEARKQLPKLHETCDQKTQEFPAGCGTPKATCGATTAASSGSPTPTSASTPAAGGGSKEAEGTATPRRSDKPPRDQFDSCGQVNDPTFLNNDKYMEWYDAYCT